ncbi:MAG: CPBP family intramembrane metalloprotease [Clostridiales bacterium]|nr:CPBP family intramembrane metalloprotease [Clostridiales bacterium]
MLNGTKRIERKYDYCGACTFYLGAIVMTIICQAIAGVVSSALVGKYPDISKNGDFNTAFMIFVQAANLGFIALFSKLNGYKLNFSIVKNQDDGKAITPSVIIVPVVAAGVLLVGMYLPTIWYGYFTRYALHVPPDFGQLNLTTPSSIAMVVIASVFFAPVCEETIYRGVLFNGLKQERTLIKAVLLSALAFMLMHMSPVQVVFQFALGVASAFIMHRSKRLLPSVLLHAAANALALVMELTPLSGALSNCVAWLTNNVAAAFFITLGLFVACGGALFVLVRFGFDLPALFRRNGRGADKADRAAERNGNEEQRKVSTEQDNNTPDRIRDEIKAAARKKDGTFRFWAGIAICAVLLVINLVVTVV